MKMKEFGPPGGRASLASPPLDPPMNVIINLKLCLSASSWFCFLVFSQGQMKAVFIPCFNKNEPVQRRIQEGAINYYLINFAEKCMK